METNNSKNLIPNAISKRQLITAYHPLPEREIIRNINEIIFDNRKKLKLYRNKTQNEIIKTSYVWKAELLEFAEMFGYPEKGFLDR